MSQRERQTTWILCLVCFSFLGFIVPMSIYDQLSYFNVEIDPYVGLTVQLFYWLHYSANIFIYAAGPQYRRAYLFFLAMVSM